MAEKRGRKVRGPGRAGPMQVTASSGYAIHGLGYLAWRKKPVVFLSEIADYFKIPASYLAKVFQALARGGLVNSFRGAKGGYSLARAAKDINFREIVEIFEGPVSDICSLNRGPCVKRPSCGVFRRLADAQRAFLAALENHTVGDIAAEIEKAEGAAAGGAKASARRTRAPRR